MDQPTIVYGLFARLGQAKLGNESQSMNNLLANVLACPFDHAAPLSAAWADEAEGLLRCGTCATVFAIVQGVPHLVRPQLREIELERQMLARHSPSAFPAEWLASLESAWAKGEQTRSADDQRLLDEGRYWSRYFEAYMEQGSLTLLDARHKGTHLPYLGYGLLAVDDRDRFRVHDHWPNAIGQRIVRFFEETRAAGAKRYLDFACGGGQFGLEACYHGAQSVGFDLATSALVAGRQYARDNQMDAHYVRAEPNALPFQPRAFDAMALKDALHHLPDARGALKAAKRVLKEEAGVLIIDHVADKPRWEKVRQRVFEKCASQLLRQYPRIEGAEVFQSLSPCEFASVEDIRDVIRDEVEIAEWRNELLFADEITLPIYLITGRKKFPAEYLSRMIYRAERLALLWGGPRFIFVRGRVKTL